MSYFRLPAALPLTAAGLVVGLLGAVSCGSAEDVANTPASSTSASQTAATSDVAPSTDASSEPPTSASDLPTTAPSSATPPPSSASPTGSPPASGARVGDCYDLSPAAFTQRRDDSAPVPCSRSHNAETFAVFKTTILPTPDDTARAWRRCFSTFKTYVGASTTVSTLGLTLIFPGEKKVTAGESWMRCDAVERFAYNGARGVSRRGSLEGMLDRGVPDDVRGCVRRWPKVNRPAFFSSCRAPHQAELIPVSRSLGRAEAAYPGRQAAKRAADSFCSEVFQDWVPETNRYYYYFPTKSSWRAGPHDTTCWALDPDGDRLPPI